MSSPSPFRALTTAGSRLLRSRHGAVLLGLLLFCCVSLITRVALLAKSLEMVSWNASLVGSFLIGLVYDVGAASFICLPLILLLTLLPENCFSHRWVRLLFGLLTWVACFLLLFGVVAEWLFWDEFATRFNFIAVDYLVYTQEVLANIRESYPMPWIFASLGVASVLLLIVVIRSGLPTVWVENASAKLRSRFKMGAIWFCALLAFGLVIRQEMIPSFANNYNRELAKNGLWSLFTAFWENELDFDTFYPTMPTETAFERIRGKLLTQDSAKPLNKDPFDLLRLVPAPDATAPEKKLNVIQITVESLSAEFLARYGNQQHITPVLDELMTRSLIFDHFYATGNRTDRGMEALTLSVPPTPGRSLVKRPRNEHLFTLGSVFRSRGYETAFIYGGYGYFDNMNYFFGENGYEVLDRARVAKADISFANAWGACDEDVFRWAIREADRISSTGKPFHFFVMTTSNHRPYTFPEGRIDLPSKTSGRAGAVKYTDYAIGALLKEASKHAWYKDTLFVIVADHCASSAGKAELPVDRYHIPLIIFSPGGQIPVGQVATLTSQVDFAPTLLALLNWSYPSRFFGKNVMSSSNRTGEGRAFIANYQRLGYLKEHELSILKPVKERHTFSLDGAASKDSDGIDEAIANYQVASWLFKHRKQSESSAAEFALGIRPANGGQSSGIAHLHP